MSKYKKRLIMYFIAFISLLAPLVYSCINYMGQIKENKKLAVELEEKYNALLDKEDSLEKEVVKLQDSEYVAKYAREKYLYSKEGELIIDISSLEETE